MRSVTKKLLFFIFCLLLLVALFWIWHSSSKPNSATTKDSAASTSLTVVLSPVTTQLAPQVVSVYGSIISPASAQIAALDAAVVEKILFTPGQHVTQGQLLFSLKPTSGTTQVAALQSAMQQAGQHYQRMVQVNHQSPGSVAQDTLGDAKNNYQQAQQAYKAAVAAAKITAPTPGVISVAQVAVGDAVTAGQVLATLVAAHNLQVQYTLPSQYLSAAKVGQAVTFIASGQTEPFSGQVIYVAPQLDANSALTIRAKLNANPKLSPNQFGQVRQIINAKHQVLMVPQTLVQTDAGGFFVYGVAIGKVVKHYFKPGTLTAQGWLEVHSGLTAGTLIITKNSGALNVGQKVQVANK